MIDYILMIDLRQNLRLLNQSSIDVYIVCLYDIT